MISMKHFTPPGIIVLLALSGPAVAQDDPALCADASGLVQALEASSGLPHGGCPKVQIFSIHGDAHTACVLYFSDGDGVADTPALEAPANGRSPGEAIQTLLTY